MITCCTADHIVLRNSVIILPRRQSNMLEILPQDSDIAEIQQEAQLCWQTRATRC